MKRKIFHKLIAVGILAVLLVVLLVAKQWTAVCEFVANTFAKWWIFVFGNVSGIVPFSLYELLLVVLIASIIFLVVKIVKLLSVKQYVKLISFVLSVAIFALSFGNLYTLTAGFIYNRQGLPTDVYQTYRGDDFDLDKAVQLANYVIDEVNFAYENTDHDQDGNIVYPFDFETVNQMLRVEYERLDNYYFFSYTPKAKRILNKWIMSQLHITGVFFAPFGEANVNPIEDGLFLPHTLAHEQAHGKGVMQEYQANVVATYVLLYCDNVYLRYGALVRCLSSVLSLVKMYPNWAGVYDELTSKINDGIFVELSNYNKRFGKYHLLDDFGEWLNDLYLKLNNQGGTSSYHKPSEVVDTTEKDDYGNPIKKIINFNETQNLLITMAKNDLFVKGKA